MLYFLWEIEHILFEYCAISSCHEAFTGFQGVPDRPWIDPDI